MDQSFPKKVGDYKKPQKNYRKNKEEKVGIHKLLIS